MGDGRVGGGIFLGGRTKINALSTVLAWKKSEYSPYFPEKRERKKESELIWSFTSFPHASFCPEFFSSGQLQKKKSGREKKTRRNPSLLTALHKQTHFPLCYKDAASPIYLRRPINIFVLLTPPLPLGSPHSTLFQPPYFNPSQVSRREKWASAKTSIFVSPNSVFPNM